LLLDAGRMVAFGDVQEMLRKYDELLHMQSGTSSEDESV
jgi:hypothetical protein